MTPLNRAAGERILQYRIIRLLGKGGMGEVFLAEDTILRRRVALKFLTSDLKPDVTIRELLLREARAAAGLDHPYICKIHEIGEAEGWHFIAMEYVEGATIREMLSAGPLPLDQVLHLSMEIVEALESAHRQDTIHRDLKPANIMVSSTGHVKVMDFGLAKRVLPEQPDQAQTASVLTQPGLIAGTPAYMSPEQLRNDPLDPRSDQFALGVLLYEMWSGQQPFQKKSFLETTFAILNDTPPPLSRYRKDVPAGLERIIGKMLAKDRDQRYPSAKEVHDEIAEVQRQTLTGGIPAPRHSPILSRRQAVLLMLAMLLLAGGSWWAYRAFYHSPQTVLAFRARDWILIPDFENLTGEDVFNESLHAALTMGIEQSKYVNVFPRSRIQETLRRMGKDRPQLIDEKLGREIAIREGIKGLLVCSIARVGDTYSLTARLLAPNTQLTALTEVSRASNKNDVLRALDDLAKRIRKRLGESLSGMGEPNLALPQATTASLEALKLFAMSRHPTAGRKGTDLLEQAVQLDPNFALAHADLGVDYYIAANRPLGEEHFKKALTLLNRLTLKEQLWIRAVVEDWRGNRDEAISDYESYVAQYPDALDGWFRLGWARMITGRSEQAIQAFQKVLEIDPKNSGARVNIATAYKGLRKPADALANYQKAFALNPEDLYGMYVNHEYGFTLVEMGKLQDAEETFDKMLSRDAARKARGHRSLALLRMYQGKYEAAIPHLKEAILIDKALQSPLSELRDRLFLARVYRLKGIRAGFEGELHAASQIHATTAMSPDWSLYLGTIYAREGKLPEARLVLEKAERAVSDTLAISSVNRDARRDRACVETLKAEVELAHSKSAHVTETLEVANRLFPDPSTLEPLAYAYWKLGHQEEAARKYKELAETPRLGSESQEDWILAHYQLGKLYQQGGDIDSARRYYERFLLLWKDGDLDLPAIVDARKQLTRLPRA
jgi:serine/threonine protein kinase/tetratricopeptide (TPR) repeat protein